MCGPGQSGHQQGGATVSAGNSRKVPEDKGVSGSEGGGGSGRIGTRQSADGRDTPHHHTRRRLEALIKRRRTRREEDWQPVAKVRREKRVSLREMCKCGVSTLFDIVSCAVHSDLLIKTRVGSKKV